MKKSQGENSKIENEISIDFKIKICLVPDFQKKLPISLLPHVRTLQS
jgi:hypothetical protein